MRYIPALGYHTFFGLSQTESKSRSLLNLHRISSIQLVSEHNTLVEYVELIELLGICRLPLFNSLLLILSTCRCFSPFSTAQKSWHADNITHWTRRLRPIIQVDG